MPGGNVKLGLVARHTKGQHPRYPIFFLGLSRSVLRPTTTRATTSTSRPTGATGGSSTLNTRTQPQPRGEQSGQPRHASDFSGTTGSVGWNWRPTAKIQLGLQYTRDTGQETTDQPVDVNRIYTSWQLNGSYALTAKLGLNANASRNGSRRDADSGAQLADAFDNDKVYGIGLRWAYSRGLSLSCQYNRASRDSSIAAVRLQRQQLRLHRPALVY